MGLTVQRLEFPGKRPGFQELGRLAALSLGKDTASSLRERPFSLPSCSRGLTAGVTSGRGAKTTKSSGGALQGVGPLEVGRQGQAASLVLEVTASGSNSRCFGSPDALGVQRRRQPSAARPCLATDSATA